jgi:putative peptidoglycan lipid II flippase
MPNLLRIESFRRGIVYSTALNVFARGLGFVTNIVIAHYFGAQTGTDVYFFVLATVTVVVTFVTSVNASVVIPESMRLLVHEGEEAAQGFVNLFLYSFGGIGITVSLLTAMVPVSFFSLFSGFADGVLADHRMTLMAGFPLFTLMMIANLLLDVLASRKFFTLPMLASIANNVFVLVAILAFRDLFGVHVALLGLTAAYALQVVFLLNLLHRGLGWRFGSVRWHIRPSARRNVLFAQLGNFTSVLSTYLPVVWISGLAAGSIAALNYGQRLADIPNGLLIAQVSAVVGIKFNDLYAQGMLSDIERVMMEVIGSLEFVLVPFAVFMSLMSREIIQLVYQHGSFSPQAVEDTALVLRVLALLVPLYLVSTVVSRLFMAAQKIRESLVYQAAFNAVLLCGTYLSVRTIGLVGYPLVLLGMHILNIFACDVLFTKLLPGIRYRGVLAVLRRDLLRNIVPATAVAVTMMSVDAWSPLLRLVTMGGLYLIMFAGISLLVNRTELIQRVVAFRRVTR